MSVTVVTCYYKIKSKHSFEEYDKWMNYFLNNVDCNLVIFTSPDLKEYLLEKRPGILREKTFIICKKLSDLDLSQKYSNKWDYQYSIDQHSRYGRTIECYIIWNSKLWFLKNTININPFNSDKFVWTDIGCLRESNYIPYLKNYPNYDFISNDKLDISLLNPITNKTQTFFLGETHFSGAIFGSHKDVILKIYDIFYQRLDEFINKKYFIGCDQQTIASIYNSNPNLFNPVCIIYLLPNNNNTDPWFSLWFYYTCHKNVITK
jgi:hypothetical protein